MVAFGTTSCSTAVKVNSTKGRIVTPNSGIPHTLKLGHWLPGLGKPTIVIPTDKGVDAVEGGDDEPKGLIAAMKLQFSAWLQVTPLNGKSSRATPPTSAEVVRGNHQLQNGMNLSYYLL